MGLMDELTRAAGAAEGAGSSGNLTDGIMDMLGGQQGGGLMNLIQQFNAGGLGDIMQSWISTGQNLPISQQQIQSVLGNQMIQGVAKRAGISPDAAGAGLAQLLPKIIDQLTPNGSVPESGMLEQGLNLLRGQFKLP